MKTVLSQLKTEASDRLMASLRHAWPTSLSTKTPPDWDLGAGLLKQDYPASLGNAEGEVTTGFARNYHRV
jgi:hypothetical protein